MPVIATPASSTLQLRLHTGTDDKGNPIIRTRTVRNVKVNALDEDVHAVGMAMVLLQQHPHCMDILIQGINLHIAISPGADDGVPLVICSGVQSELKSAACWGRDNRHENTSLLWSTGYPRLQPL